MTSFAVVQTGGKQYRVQPGDVLDVERLPMDVGDPVDLSDVRLIADDGEVLVGSPQVEGALVRAQVVEHLRGPKLVVFKYKPKTRYRRKTGHRQELTRLQIEDLVLPGSATEEKPAPKRRRASSAKAAEAEEAPPVAQAPEAEAEEAPPAAQAPEPEAEEAPPAAQAPEPEAEEAPPAAQAPEPEAEEAPPAAQTPEAEAEEEKSDGA